jgi:hypothetical protein
MKTNFIKFKLSSALLAAAALCFAAYVISSEAILKQAASVWKNRPEKIYTAKSLVVDGSPDKIKDARSAEFAFDGKGSVKVSLKGEGAGRTPPRSSFINTLLSFRRYAGDTIFSWK